jgi:hypothetical protein
MAQPITTSETYQVFPKSNRQIGSFESASALVPEGVHSVAIASDIAAADASNEANSALIVLESSTDGGMTWQPASMMNWQGGTHFDKHTQTIEPNYIAWTVGVNQEWTGRRARIRVDLPQRLNFGLTITVNPPETAPVP